MTKAIIFDLDSCLAAADEVGGVRTGVCGGPRHQRWQCLERKVAHGVRRVLASRSTPSPTNTVAMRAAGWQVLRQTEVTGPM